LTRRDGFFPPQRYGGEPIPLVYCEKCGWVPLPESELPLRLPEVKSYETTDDGQSPLAHMDEWVNTTCPHCGGPAKRETDTMPQWAGSSWYYLRYMDPHNADALVGKEALDYWHQVDWYNGGMEHTTLHLLYSRFWHKFLYDLGLVPTKEPYYKRTSHGMILGEGGEKMSKSRGNVVNPNDIVNEFGADTLRLYIMFIGDFEKSVPWSSTAVKGCKRFLDRIWNLAEVRLEGDKLSKANESEIHKAIKKVSEDIEGMKFNTAIATLMSLVNVFYENKPTRGDMKALLLMLSGCASLPPTPAPSSAPTAALQDDAARPAAASSWVRSELYFGVGEEQGAGNRPQADTISEAQWRAFLDKEVTPRFPDGLTVFDAYGQWLFRGDTSPNRLRTKVLVVLHEDTPQRRADIEAIRLAWKQQTKHQSVLWSRQAVDVSF